MDRCIIPLGVIALCIFLGCGDTVRVETSDADESDADESDTGTDADEEETDGGTSQDGGDEDEPVEPDSDQPPDGDGPHLSCAEELAELATDQDLLGQVFLPKFEYCDALATIRPGGVVYYGPDISDEETLRSDNRSLLECARDEHWLMAPLTSTNHEGGRIFYFDDPTQMTHFPSAMDQCDQGEDYVYEVSLAQAEELLYCGINTTLGPVADVLLAAKSTVIGHRSYAYTTPEATACVRQAVIGYSEGGIFSTLKHFPGHGGTPDDTHFELAYDHVTLSEMRESHIPPFETGLFVSDNDTLVMMSHVVFDEIDPSWPASLSFEMYDELRDHMGFDGAVMTDELGMRAIADQWGVVGAALRALMAGADLLLIMNPHSVFNTYLALEAGLDSGLELRLIDLEGESVVVTYTAEEVRARLEEAFFRIAEHKCALGLDDIEAQIDLLDTTPEPDWSAHQALTQY